MHGLQWDLLTAVIRIVAFSAVVASAVPLARWIARQFGQPKGRTTVPSLTCPGQLSPSCACQLYCTGACNCPACAVTYFGGGAGGAGSNAWAVGGAGGSSAGSAGGGRWSAGAGGGSGGIGGSSAGSAGASFAPLSSSAAHAPPAWRPSGAGMSGFAEHSARDFEFAVGSVLGLRQWTLNTPDLRGNPHHAETRWPHALLRGATGYAWAPGVLEAVCNNDSRHQAPVEFDSSTGEKCGCGFWSYWDTAALAGNRLPVSRTSMLVLGVIEGYGRVLLGERGFRSQKAKIVALALASVIRADLLPNRDPYGNRYLMPRNPFSDPYQAFAAERKHDEQESARQREAQQHADAWLAVIQDRLMTTYPGADVYATAGGLLASVQTRGKPC